MKILQRDITFNDYLIVFRRVQRRRISPRSASSIFEILLSQDRRTSGDWPAQLRVAETVAQLMTTDERRKPVVPDRPRQEELARLSRIPTEQVEQLFRHFELVREVARDYLRCGLWGRIRILTKNDPLINWLMGRRGKKRRNLS
jgi:hypothetical protein